MRKVFKRFGVIAFVAIIGFGFAALSLTGCGGGDDGGGGPNPVMRTVTFNANGGTVEGETTKAVKVEVGKTVKAPDDPVYGSKKFWGWFGGKTEGKYGNRFNPETPITWDMTVFARWGDEVPPASFNVTFDANGGTYTGGKKTEIIQVYQGEKVDPPSPTRNDGYMVSGWYRNAACSGTAFKFDEEEITETLTLYAQWKKPEEVPAKDRWNVWQDSSSKATLEGYTIDDEGLCTVIVGGTPEQHGDGVWRAWTVCAQYIYTAQTGKRYEYTFEAWTESGTRELHVQYYEDNIKGVYKGETRSITSTRDTYVIQGEKTPKGGMQYISFQLADQTGKVNIKMINIEEFTEGGSGSAQRAPHVTYIDAEDNDGDPIKDVDYRLGDTVTVIGPDRPRPGYTFICWRTEDGTEYNVGDTFVMNSRFVRLYAIWKEDE
jgi:hypothetical protein